MTDKNSLITEPPAPAQEPAIDRILQRIAELPDRTSPDEWPEIMLVTAAELRSILRDELAARVLPVEPAQDREARVLGTFALDVNAEKLKHLLKAAHRVCAHSRSAIHDPDNRVIVDRAPWRAFIDAINAAERQPPAVLPVEPAQEPHESRSPDGDGQPSAVGHARSDVDVTASVSIGLNRGAGSEPADSHSNQCTNLSILVGEEPPAEQGRT